MNPIQSASALGQQIWLDAISRQLLQSGELARMIEQDGIAGVTSNPAIFEQAIAKDPAYSVAKAKLPPSLSNPEMRFEALALPDIQAACDAFMPMYSASKGRKGFVSFEVSPSLSHDVAGTVAAAKRLWAAINRPNAMIKIPATLAGLEAVRQSIAAGINVNVTLMFSPKHVQAVAQAHAAGLADRLAAGQSITDIRSVASVFISRVDTRLDPLLPENLQGKIAIAAAKVAYDDWQKNWSATGKQFADLAQKGATPQWLLWASTGTKNPAYSDVLYIDSLIGDQTVNTIPTATLNAFRDHGQAQANLLKDIALARSQLETIRTLGIDLNAVGDTLQQEGLVQFEKAFETLLQNVG